MLIKNNLAIYIFFVILILLTKTDAKTAKLCLDSCLCIPEDGIIDCDFSLTGRRNNLSIPETHLRGFTIIQAYNNPIRVLPSENILLEKFPDLKVLDVTKNAVFNCSTLKNYKQIILLTDCNETVEQLEADDKKISNLNLFVAVRASYYRGFAKLLAKEADVNLVNAQGDSLLQMSVDVGNAKMVDLLVSRGANVDAQNLNSFRPLYSAANAGNNEIVNILLRAGADILSTDYSGGTAFYWAVSFPTDSPSLTVLQTLLSQPLSKYGRGGKVAYVNAKNKRGNTALHLAYERNFMDVVNFLVENGADGSIKNDEGKTPKEMKHEHYNNNSV